MTKLDVSAGPLSAEQLARLRGFGYGWFALTILLPLAAVVWAYNLAGEAAQVAALFTLVGGVVAYTVMAPQIAGSVTRFYLFATSPIEAEQCERVLGLVSRYPELARYVDAVSGQGRRLSDIELAAMCAYEADEGKRANWAEFLSVVQGSSPSDAPSGQEARRAALSTWRASAKWVLLVASGFIVGGLSLAFAFDPGHGANKLAEAMRMYGVAVAWVGWFFLVLGGASVLFERRSLYAEVTSRNLLEIAVIKALNPEAFTRYVGAVHAQGRELMRSELAGLRRRYLKENRKKAELELQEACVRVHSGNLSRSGQLES